MADVKLKPPAEFRVLKAEPELEVVRAPKADVPKVDVEDEGEAAPKRDPEVEVADAAVPNILPLVVVARLLSEADVAAGAGEPKRDPEDEGDMTAVPNTLPLVEVPRVLPEVANVVVGEPNRDPEDAEADVPPPNTLPVTLETEVVLAVEVVVGELKSAPDDEESDAAVPNILPEADEEGAVALKSDPEETVALNKLPLVVVVDETPEADDVVAGEPKRDPVGVGDAEAANMLPLEVVAELPPETVDGGINSEEPDKVFEFEKILAVEVAFVDVTVLTGDGILFIVTAEVPLKRLPDEENRLPEDAVAVPPNKLPDWVVMEDVFENKLPVLVDSPPGKILLFVVVVLLLNKLGAAVGDVVSTLVVVEAVVVEVPPFVLPDVVAVVPPNKLDEVAVIPPNNFPGDDDGPPNMLALVLAVPPLKMLPVAGAPEFSNKLPLLDGPDPPKALVPNEAVGGEISFSGTLSSMIYKVGGSTSLIFSNKFLVSFDLPEVLPAATDVTIEVAAEVVIGSPVPEVVTEAEEVVRGVNDGVPVSVTRDVFENKLADVVVSVELGALKDKVFVLLDMEGKQEVALDGITLLKRLVDAVGDLKEKVAPNEGGELAVAVLPTVETTAKVEGKDNDEPGVVAENPTVEDDEDAPLNEKAEETEGSEDCAEDTAVLVVSDTEAVPKIDEAVSKLRDTVVERFVPLGVVLGTFDTIDESASKGLALLVPSSSLTLGVWGGVMSSYCTFPRLTLPTDAAAIEGTPLNENPVLLFLDAAFSLSFVVGTLGILAVCLTDEKGLEVLDSEGDPKSTDF